MNTKEAINNNLCKEIRDIFSNKDEKFYEGLQEIRIRALKPLVIKHGGENFFVKETGELSEKFEGSYLVTEKDVYKTIERISEYSMYAFQEEIKNGYITVYGGHRVGITGKVVSENGKIKTIKNINNLNIRISHEIKGCSNKILQYLVDEKKEVENVLIISPPACGKTTLLRDIVRNFSYGSETVKSMNVGIVDERSEIAGCYKGIAQNDVGFKTDILDSCPKAEGMTMLLRAMSPEVIAVDEIGKKEDVQAIYEIMNCGIKLICTVHGNTVEEIKMKAYLGELIDKKIFDKYIILGNGIGNVKGIYNKDFALVYGGDEF